MNVNQGQAVHVGQAASMAGNPYCGLTTPVCPTECPQRRLLGGFVNDVPQLGGAGRIEISTQIPVVMRCWGISRAAAASVRISSIINGVTNLILGGTVHGDAGLPFAITCGSVLDGYMLLPGQKLIFDFVNYSGQVVSVDIWISGELVCP